MKLHFATAGLLIWSCFPAIAQQSGANLCARHCARCHDAGDPQSRVPSSSALQLMSFKHVLRIITSGSMAEMTKERTDDERKAIASFVTGRISSDPPSAAAKETSATCGERPVAFGEVLDAPRWNGRGADLKNSRFQPMQRGGLAPHQVPKLRLI
jgi:polyvinyl alcohol dehydrogenase (cytochrome)